MKSPLARRLIGVAVLAALLAPAAWTKLVCMDDWADETCPFDNPETPTPDLCANKRFEDGVQSMPDLSPSTPAQDAEDVFPTGHTVFFAEAIYPGRVFFERLFSGSPRAPPVFSVI